MWQVADEKKISSSAGGFAGALSNGDLFGQGLDTLSDLDGDNVPELVVGAMWDDDGGSNRGAVWILFLDSDGTVKSHQKISSIEGGFTGSLSNGDWFGVHLAAIGDLDGDSVEDLAVCANLDDDGGTNRGAVWILFLNSDGTVKSHQKISDTQGGFTAPINSFDEFGTSVAAIGDLDGDGVTELAVGEHQDDDGGSQHGAVWILFMNSDGTVKSHQKISQTAGGFSGTLDGRFGVGVTGLGDLDGDGLGDIAVGHRLDNDGGTDRGAVFILFLNADGTVKSQQKISDLAGGFTGELDDGDEFAWNPSILGDLDGDGVVDLAVSSRHDDDGGSDRGAVWILFLNSDGTVKEHTKISSFAGGFEGALSNDDELGMGIAFAGDLDGDGAHELFVGARFDDDGGTDRGAVHVLSLATCPDPINADWKALSVTSGDTQRMCLNAGAANGGKPYLLLGSMSGTEPGLRFGGQRLPLNLDDYLLWTFRYPGAAPLSGSRGVLDANGRAEAEFSVPPLPMLVGLTVHHAFGVVELSSNSPGQTLGARPAQLSFVSPPVSLELLP